MPGFQKLRATCPILATWDDHDLGVDDGGVDYPRKVESQKIFLDFFGDPADSPRRKREGVYDARVFGPEGKRVQIILLDTRYFRSELKEKAEKVRGEGPYVPDPDPKKTMLGEAQWAWFAEQLKQPAEVRIIGSSIQVVAEDHGWEKWENLPKERERLFQLLKESKSTGVIFLSGDRHLAELSVMDADLGYPVFDLTSSGLNQGSRRWRPLEENRRRVATMAHGDNSGLIEVAWSGPDPEIRLQIRDTIGDIIIQEKINLSLLKPRPPAARRKVR